MITKILRVAGITLLIIPLFILNVKAQEPDPDQGGNGPPVGAPVDGGALLFLIAGAVFGAKKLYRIHTDKQNKTEN